MRSSRHVNSNILPIRWLNQLRSNSGLLSSLVEIDYHHGVVAV
jgi:hypothetical protein